jgi:trichothecene 3-O-acetyltransferase
MASKMRQPGIFGQLTWDTYTIVVLGFAEQTGSTSDDVMKTLDTSALQLLQAFPFLAGKVTKHGQTSTNSGTYEIVPYPPHDNKSPVRRKDCTNLCPSYEELVAADAPFSMLNGDTLCPVRGMGHAYNASHEQPVLIIQANFVKGGLLLCCASHHNALDMNGQGMVIKMLAAAGRGEGFDPDMVVAGNRDADTIVPLLEPGEEGLAFENMRRPSTLNAGEPRGSPPTAPWKYWRFTSDMLRQLKTEASKGDGWISTNDAVTAFFVQRLTASRIAAKSLHLTGHVQFQRAIDGRQVLRPQVHPGYLGHMVALCETQWQSAEELRDASLSDVALKMRNSLKSVDDYFIRSLATLIKTTEDRTTIFYGVTNKAGRDFMTSSWAQLHWAFETDFGPGLGVPDLVRRPYLDEVPDLSYLMPRDKKGNMHLATSLFTEDYDALAADKTWNTYAELVG